MDKVISVIMPSYNRGRIISRAIDSVLNQSFRSFELLIVDDASDDGTKQMIEKYHDKRIRYLKNRRRHGAAFSRNRGMEESTGEYIAFLDTDNEWKPDYLTNRIHQMETLGTDIAFGRVEKWNECVSYWPEEEIEEGIIDHDCLIRMLCIYNPMDTNSVVIKRKCFEEMGGFDTSFVRLQDWEYFFKLVQSRKYKVSYDGRINVILYIQPDSIANNGKFWEMRLKLLKKQIDLILDLDVENELIESFEISPEEGGLSYYHFDKVFSLILKTGGNTKIQNLLWNQLSKLKSQKEIMQGQNCLIENQKQCIESQGYGFKRDNKILACYERWMRSESSGKGVVQILRKRNVTNIVIYGMGYLGRSLVEVLKDSYVQIIGIIDKNPKTRVSNVKCISDLDEIGSFDQMDMIIVTAINDFTEICSELNEHVDIPVISLEDLIV